MIPTSFVTMIHVSCMIPLPPMKLKPLQRKYLNRKDINLNNLQLKNEVLIWEGHYLSC